MAHDSGHADAAAHHVAHHPDEKEHPSWDVYWRVATVLTLITIMEVWVYYTPFRQHSMFAPTLLAMSAVKFTIVVLFYMHLRYDHKLFRALFTGPLIIAMGTIVALLFLFGHFGVVAMQ
jgi:cytochrome c oxidase subunit 4